MYKEGDRIASELEFCHAVASKKGRKMAEYKAVVLLEAYFSATSNTQQKTIV